MRLLAVRVRLGEADYRETGALPPLQTAELGCSCRGVADRQAEEEGGEEEGREVRIAGGGIALVGLWLVVFYGFSLSFSAHGSEMNGALPWTAEAGYAVQSRLGLAAGAVLIAGGISMEREAKKKAAK